LRRTRDEAFDLEIKRWYSKPSRKEKVKNMHDLTTVAYVNLNTYSQSFYVEYPKNSFAPAFEKGIREFCEERGIRSTFLKNGEISFHLTDRILTHLEEVLSAIKKLWESQDEGLSSIFSVSNSPSSRRLALTTGDPQKACEFFCGILKSPSPSLSPIVSTVANGTIVDEPDYPELPYGDVGEAISFPEKIESLFNIQ
jgi:hypothetical protein